MDYNQTLEFLYSRLPFFQRDGKKAYKPDLSRTTELLSILGEPHLKFKSVHIAGTNGKGSSAHALHSIISKAGYKTGLYTSPHLKRFTERIKVNGDEIEDSSVVHFVEKLVDDITTINPSFFELTVAMAFDYFAAREVDIAVVEVGLGGRLDSTNVITPEVSLITNIGYDHQDLLGETLVEIAGEKAGIIKAGVPVVIGSHQPEVENVFKDKALRLKAPYNNKAAEYQLSTSVFHDLNRKSVFKTSDKEWRISTDVWVDYFQRNIPGVLETVEELRLIGYKISDKDVAEGLAVVSEYSGLKGRGQILQESPLMVADVSHNAEGFTILFDNLESLEFSNLIIVLGMVNDKNMDKVTRIFPVNAYYYFTSADGPRSMEAKKLMQHFDHLKGEVVNGVNNAVRSAKARAEKNDLILITGSTFVVAELEEL